MDKLLESFRWNAHSGFKKTPKYVRFYREVSFCCQLFVIDVGMLLEAWLLLLLVVHKLICLQLQKIAYDVKTRGTSPRFVPGFVTKRLMRLPMEQLKTMSCSVLCRDDTLLRPLKAQELHLPQKAQKSHFPYFYGPFHEFPYSSVQVHPVLSTKWYGNSHFLFPQFQQYKYRLYLVQAAS